MSARTRKLFVNLPVKQLGRAVDFFTQLGFTFDEEFTDDSATCMVVGEGSYVMLLTEERFAGFTEKRIVDAATHTEALFAVQLDTREQVDELADLAIANGGTEAGAAQDHDVMYVRSFHDLDGHTWELFWLDADDDGDEEPGDTA